MALTFCCGTPHLTQSCIFLCPYVLSRRACTVHYSPLLFFLYKTIFVNIPLFLLLKEMLVIYFERVTLGSCALMYSPRTARTKKFRIVLASQVGTYDAGEKKITIRF
uniref:Uncharacterized protein n=1 Tax=Cacopsylla melanoneura TaxID=428564 RepID=A0A8D9EL82_9HEMI